MIKKIIIGIKIEKKREKNEKYMAIGTAITIGYPAGIGLAYVLSGGTTALITAFTGAPGAMTGPKMIQEHWNNPVWV